MARWIRGLLLFSLSALLYLEVLFRTVIPASEPPASRQLPGGILVYDPAYRRSGTVTLGRVPLSGYRWRLNEEGWNSGEPFLPDSLRKRPLIALIGDSSVEGLWCDFDEHPDRHLQKALGERFEVYAFGRGAQPLSQMLVLMDRIDSLYAPDVFVIFAGSELLSGSFPQGDPPYDYHHLLPAGSRDSFRISEPSAVVPIPAARLLMRSALVRYLQVNAMLDLFPMMRDVGDPFVAPLLPRERRTEMLSSAGRFLLAEMSEILDGRPLLIAGDNYEERLMMEGDPRANAGIGRTLREEFSILADLAGEFPEIDYMALGPAFSRAWSASGRRFESGDGRHLDGYGNSIAAAAIADRLDRGRYATPARTASSCRKT